MSNPAESLKRDRADLSQFLVHLTRNGTFERYIDLGNGRYTWEISDRLDAEDSLKKIITSNHIEARSPLGYFKFKIDTRWRNRGGVQPSWLKSVCFSETPLSELNHFYKATVRKKNQYQKFGLGFWEQAIRSYGGNPIFYLDTRKPQMLQSLDQMVSKGNNQHFKNLMPFMEPFGPPLYKTRSVDEIDFRWEREWRVPGNLSFQPNYVAFGICHQDRINEFEQLANNAYPFIDPDWSLDKIKDYLKQRNFKKLLNAL